MDACSSEDSVTVWSCIGRDEAPGMKLAEDCDGEIIIDDAVAKGNLHCEDAGKE